MCICVHMCGDVCLVCTCVYVYLCGDVCLVCLCVHVYICICVCVPHRWCAYRYACVYVYVCVCVYVYVCVSPPYVRMSIHRMASRAVCVGCIHYAGVYMCGNVCLVCICVVMYVWYVHVCTCVGITYVV